MEVTGVRLRRRCKRVNDIDLAMDANASYRPGLGLDVYTFVYFVSCSFWLQSRKSVFARCMLFSAESVGGLDV
jgi:hypothetical protein